jgi:hypothetical protein
VARPGWTYNIAHGRSHLVDLLSGAQGIDVSRFFPSAVRVNLALWIWPPLVLLALLALWRWRRRAGRGALWLGAAIPVALLAKLVAAAHVLPTRVAEAEDPYVAHAGGAVWPEDWVVGRTRFRGGWRLRPTDVLTLPVVPGGRYLSLELELRRFGVTRPLVRIRPARSSPTLRQLGETDRWTTLRLDDLPWPEGAQTLEISLQLPPRADPQAAILLDRARLRWSDSRRAETSD